MDELMLLRALEEKARRMFDFTGWADNVDDDAAQAIINVDAVLQDLTNWRLLQSRYADKQQADSSNG